MIQQNYNLGEPFYTYTSVELSTNEWKWNHRTLSGFRDEDGNFVELSGLITRNTPAATLSGVWTLDKSEHLLSVFNVGSNGQLALSVVEINVEKPLGDNQNPYQNTQEFSLTTGQVSTTEVFYQLYTDNTTTGSTLSICISAIGNTIIKCISAHYLGTQLTSVYPNDSKYIVISSQCYDIGEYWTSLNNQLNITNSDLWQGLSVETAEGGILTYVPNKDTLTPNHPQD